MDWLDTVSSSLIGKDLDGLWARQKAISDNMANFETPGYKTKRVSFEDQLSAQLANAGTSDSEISRKHRQRGTGDDGGVGAFVPR